MSLVLSTPSHCHFSFYHVEAAEASRLGRREALPQREAADRRGGNPNLESEVNAYLAQVSAEDGVEHRPVRVHFIVASNSTDWSFCMVTASCALAGVRLSILGVGAPYSHVWRYENYLDYLDRQGVQGEDVVVTLDTDVAWTGSDVVPFLQKFARYSPASEAALDLAAVRAWEDYGEEVASEFMKTVRAASEQPTRPLVQLPPILFNADDDCYYHQPVERLFQCFTGDYITSHLIAAARNGASFFSHDDAALESKETMDDYRAMYNTFFAEGVGDRLLTTPLSEPPQLRVPGDPFFYDGALAAGRNPAHYLNAGMHISRAWALREMSEAVLRFAKTRQPRVPREWFCDQSITAVLRYYSRMYEVNEGLLLETGRRGDGKLARDSFGLPVGLMSVDRFTEFMFTSHLRRRRGLGEMTPYYMRHRNDILFKLPDSDLVTARSGARITPPLWFREVPPRCVDMPGADGAVVRRCSDAKTQRVWPAFLHFAAGSKRRYYRRYRAWFAWSFAGHHSFTAMSSAMAVLADLQLELWRSDTVQLVPFYSMCPSPYHSR